MPFRHGEQVRRDAVAMVVGGVRPRAAAHVLGVDPTTVYAWLHADAPQLVASASTRCWICTVPPEAPDLAAYAQLLGLYLGDGWLGRTVNGTYALSVYCDDSWPGLADECAEVMRHVLARRVCRVARKGCHEVKAYSKHRPCLFPQHGPGKKHQRSILLEPWQRLVVDEHPGRLLRGLFHSDGWRGRNVAVKRGGETVVRYAYTRYEFVNHSEDIRGICTDALDRLDIPWRPNGIRITVNRRAAVAALDEHVGPKY